MKFSFAGILAVLGMADGKKKKNSILRQAVPVNRDGSVRKLSEDFEITADYSIVYKECSSVKVYDDDLFEEGNGISDMAKADKVVAEKSYIFFNVIDTVNEVDEEDSDTNLFMMPLATWFKYVSGEDNDTQQYCDACVKSYDKCYPEEDKEKEGGNEGGGERKLMKKRAMTPAIRAHRDSFAHLMGKRRYLADSCYQTVVDCDKCDEYDCFDGVQEEEYCDADNFKFSCAVSRDSAKEFMNYAGCVETGLDAYGNYANINMKAGLICEEHGYGVEIAMFYDENCMLYDKTMNFYYVMDGSYDYKLFNATKSQIQQPYEEDIDCSKCGYAAIDQDGDDDNEVEVNPICTNIMASALDLDSCGDEQQAYNQDEESDDVDRSWYDADIEKENVDTTDACLFFQGQTDDLSSYHVYSSKNGDGNVTTSFFDYSKSHRKKRSAKLGGKPGRLTAICVAVAMVVAAGIFFGQKFVKKDSKQVPLVGNGNGAMA